MIGDNSRPTKLGKTHWGKEYIEDCFWAWYHAGRPRWRKMQEVLPLDQDGRKPQLNTFRTWRRRYDWNGRADLLDAEVAREVEVLAIEKKVEMFNRHAEVGEAMIAKGFEYLEEHDFEDAKEAIAAIRLGVQTEVSSRGIPDAVLKASKMSDKQIIGLIESLVGRIPEEELETEVDENIVEGEFTDASESKV